MIRLDRGLSALMSPYIDASNVLRECYLYANAWGWSFNEICERANFLPSELPTSGALGSIPPGLSETVRSMSKIQNLLFERFGFGPYIEFWRREDVQEALRQGGLDDVARLLR